MANTHMSQPGDDEQKRSSGAEQPEEDFNGTAIDEWPTLPQKAAPKDDTDHAAIDEQPTKRQEAVTPESTMASAVGVYQATTMPQTALTRVEGGNGVYNKPRPVISIRNLKKTYFIGKGTRVDALAGVSLDVYPGEFVAIMGPSGSGKSTFMNLLGCLDRPTSGEYWLAGKLVSSLSSDELAAIRNRLLGFVFQGFNLLGRATAMKNVQLPMIYSGISKSEQEKRARKVLTLVGLGKRLNHKPTELSGGQQQRVAIARALVNGPSLLLADEPTGNLDSRTSVEIMGVMQALNEQGLTIVLVTHDPKVARYATRQVAFLDGQIVRDELVQDRRSAIAEWEEMVQGKSAAGTTLVKEVNE
jgi:putative ABC transport system ATP-binding protein